MFNRIMGRIAAKTAEAVFLEAGCIEWEITMPALDIRALGEVGAEAGVYTWLYHRDDQMKLFGFSAENRRALFFSLLKVEGIGPKAAGKIMGGISEAELEHALEAGDIARLEAIPGLGKKTAQKMVLALKGKLVQGERSGEASPFDDLAEALAGMGYDKRLAVKALNVAAESAGVPESGAERERVLFSKAIAYLTTGKC
jgi:Holliday junction DNA helicase RuvA